jgi:raffinose/stachyose/melibiose transport system permease protein
MKAGFTVFDYIQAMTGGGPGYATESIGILIYKHGMTEMKFGYGAAESFILFLIIALISFIQMKYLDKKGA